MTNRCYFWEFEEICDYNTYSKQNKMLYYYLSAIKLYNLLIYK